MVKKILIFTLLFYFLTLFQTSFFVHFFIFLPNLVLIAVVFFNLFENTLRHGEKVTTIIISSIKHENILSIIYEDNGSGVSMSEKNLIFERGFGKNTGYGLFLIRHILAITGMNIVENGIPGKGARFEISVPPGTFRNA